MPTNTLLRPFLDVQLPDGVGMTFDEEMVGWYFPGTPMPVPGRTGDLTIAAQMPASGDPPAGVACKFDADMVIRDVNDFVDGYEHEAQLKGTITFGQFEDHAPATFSMDDAASRFHYLRVNPATGEAEMRYHVEFVSTAGRRYALDGTKYMQKDPDAPNAIRDLLGDYTTLYSRITELLPDGTQRGVGTALLKFRTFEDLAATANLAGFLASFQVTGTSDPAVQLQARLRFLAFTAQFVQREYDPLAIAAGGHS
jgi:hypothetical protein